VRLPEHDHVVQAFPSDRADESLRAIAAGLEEHGIPAARGGKWSAVQVARLLKAAGRPFDGSSVSTVWDASDTLSARSSNKESAVALPLNQSARTLLASDRCRTLAGAKRARSANAYGQPQS
jgi:Recombinase